MSPSSSCRSSRCSYCWCLQLSYQACGAFSSSLLVTSRNTGWLHSKHRLITSQDADKWKLFSNESCYVLYPPCDELIISVLMLVLLCKYCTCCKCRCKVENCDDEDDPGFDQPWLNFTVPPGDFVIFIVNIKVFIVRVNWGRIRSLSDVQEVGKPFTIHRIIRQRHRGQRHNGPRVLTL